MKNEIMRSKPRSICHSEIGAIGPTIKPQIYMIQRSGLPWLHANVGLFQNGYVMKTKRKLYWGLLGLVFGTSIAAADEMGTSRVSLVVATLEGGGTSTNTISYDSDGLVVAYDIEIEGPMSFTYNWVFIYNANDQVEKIVTEVNTPFGGRTDEGMYTYEAGTDRLINVQVSTSNGDNILKTFSYGEDGRLTGMTMETSGQGGSATEVHTVIYNEQERLTGTAFTADGITGRDAGGYSMIYDDDGRPLSYVFKRLFQPEAAGVFSYEPNIIITNETGGISGTTEIISTFTPGPCRIPEITDGFIIETIFNGPPGFYADAACRSE